MDGDDTVPARLEAAGTCNTRMAYSTLGSIPGASTLIPSSSSFDLGFDVEGFEVESFEVEGWLGSESALGFAPLSGGCGWDDGLEE